MIDKIIMDIDQLRIKSRETTEQECQELNIFKRLDNALTSCPVHGVGLSAIQIGVPIKAFLLKLPNIEVKKFDRVEIYNPKIIEKNDPIIFKGEGCLSFPGIQATTYRFNQVTVEYNNGKQSIFVGTESVIVQHEIDHLDGIIFLNRRVMSPKTIKVGRNDPCPKCLEKGVKIKYKKCIEHYVS